jgi:hypothetical protein
MALVRRVVTLLAVTVTASCVKSHPVQPTPAIWQLPAAYKACEVRETIRWRDGWTITLYCADGMRLVDYVTGKEIEFLSWPEIKR